MKLSGKRKEDLDEDIRIARVAEIDSRLEVLSREINYVQEDIIKSLDIKLHETKQKILDEKILLRDERKELTK